MKSHSPSSCLEKLHIPNEFAHLIGINCGTRGHHQTVLLVSPFGKAWHVEVSRDGEGAFLGCGWPEFVQAYDAGVGWFVSFRYEGNIVLTVKLYDTSCCFKDFATQFADLATRKSSAASHTLQFVKVLPRDSMDVMQIPDNFVCCYIPKAQRNSQVAIIFSSLGKFWHIGFDSNESGVFLRGNWLEFLEAHDLSEGNILVFRYEGSMVFTVKRLNPLGTRKCTMPRELVFSQYTWTDGKQHRITTFSRRDSSSKEERVPISAQTLKRKATSSTTGVISIDWCQVFNGESD